MCKIDKKEKVDSALSFLIQINIEKFCNSRISHTSIKYFKYVILWKYLM